MDALSTDRPIISTRGAARRTVSKEAPRDRLDCARKWVDQLPVLARGWSAAIPPGPDDAALRLEAATWALAARREVELCPDWAVEDRARALRDAGAVTPPAADALVALGALFDADVDPFELCRVAGRLIAYLELRTELG